MHLHVISFNVPWPADYGGVIDVYHRLCALKAAGVQVHLHCYTYGREAAAELERVCCEVCYYPRATGWRSQCQRRPYIVASRRSTALLERLRHDNYPILLEGLHDCYVLEQLRGSGRRISVRAHNVEHDYYRSLAQADPAGWKRLYYTLEARKLEHYEPILRDADSVLAISDRDAAHFREMGCRNVLLLPPSHGHSEVSSLPGRGDYVLYHGNLSVPENEHAVMYLLDNIFDNLPYPLVVAGRDPGEALQRRIAATPGVRLEANPDGAAMRRLIREAQVNLLYTDQATGVKLKLMNALYEGRHCLVNPLMVEGSGVGEACHVAATVEAMRQQLTRLMETEFTAADIARRKALLHSDPIGKEILEAVTGERG